MLVGLVAAAAGPAGGQDMLQWALDQGGAFIGMGICGVGWWLAEKRVTRAEARADVERASRNVLADSIMEKVLPALDKSTAATADFISAAREQAWRRDHR